MRGTGAALARCICADIALQLSPAGNWRGTWNYRLASNGELERDIDAAPHISSTRTIVVPCPSNDGDGEAAAAAAVAAELYVRLEPSMYMPALAAGGCVRQVFNLNNIQVWDRQIHRDRFGFGSKSQNAEGGGALGIFLLFAQNVRHPGEFV
jgi:hypothetical protein